MFIRDGLSQVTQDSIVPFSDEGSQGWAVIQQVWEGLIGVTTALAAA